MTWYRMTWHDNTSYYILGTEKTFDGRSVAAVVSYFCFIIVAAVIVLWLGGIVSVVCSIVLAKGCNPFKWDLTRAATWPSDGMDYTSTSTVFMFSHKGSCLPDSQTVWRADSLSPRGRSDSQWPWTAENQARVSVCSWQKFVVMMNISSHDSYPTCLFMAAGHDSSSAKYFKNWK